MLPPPAPTERTSILGRPSRSPAIGASVVRIRLRLRIAETSKVVPPMSMTTMSGSSESARAATGASVGPAHHRVDRPRGDLAHGHHAALAVGDEERAGEARVAHRALQPAQVGRHDAVQRGVDGGRDGAAVLARGSG